MDAIPNKKTKKLSKLIKYYFYRLRQLLCKRPYKKAIGNGEHIVFSIENTTCMWRAETLLTKEEETIKWIDKMDKGSILWDIGANIGVYTLYAAKKGINCVAFEPGAANYYTLNKNIYINNIKENAIAYNIAISDTTEKGAFFMNLFESGHALHPGFDNSVLDKDGQYKQGIFSFRLDDLIEKYGFKIPDYLKIDVDGFEPQVIDGAIELLRQLKLKSVLVEIDYENESNYKRLVDKIVSSGFYLFNKEEIHLPMKIGEMRNHIFYRK